MRIYKFGGASVKDAQGVKNLSEVLIKTKSKSTLVVVSAMGKTTNAIEEIIKAYFNSPQELKGLINENISFHQKILEQLFTQNKHPVYQAVNNLFQEFQDFFKRNKSPNYSFVYDQVIGFGELVSTTIISFYLNEVGQTNQWIDVRELIKTDSFYRQANVDWHKTQLLIKEGINPKILNITQGFIASDQNNFSTSLGREGSDYTAAIFGYCLNATEVTIWKDVPGVLNADPRHFSNSHLIKQMSYTEAIELAFYGASVIHPKTLQPLQRKEIPLYVKSFLEPLNQGTKVCKGPALDPDMPCFIVKKHQTLISLSSLDFSYIMEENISEIFSMLHRYKMKVDLIQNSAISFSVCVEDLYLNLEKLLQELSAKFKVVSYKNVNLFTIRHFSEAAIMNLESEKVVLLKQLTPQTVQLITE